MIIFILMSGIFTPYESMPQWAQKFNLINPVAYLMRINRMVMLKGSTMHDISREIYSLIVIAVCFTVLGGKRGTGKTALNLRTDLYIIRLQLPLQANGQKYKFRVLF